MGRAGGPLMASDDSSGSRPAAPIVLRIKLRYDDVDAMVQRFAANVGKSGLFLPTRSLQPLGAEIKFELRLANDTPVLVGLGRVKAARAPDPQHPRAAFGMAIELMRVTPQSRALILRMLERRREVGLPELGLPMADDIDAARRAEGESGGRDLATGPVPVVVPAAASRPVAQAPVVPVVPVAVPVAPAATAPIEAAPGEALLTAPRRTTGPVAIAHTLAIAPLPPEPARRRRIAVSEVIERASGPVASVTVALPGLDDDVDLAAALARARALAGGALEAELEALCEVAAAPLEISIDVASAELARQLGGPAVRRDPTAGWAPPPATRVALPPDQLEPDPPPAPGSAFTADAVPSAVADAEPLYAEPIHAGPSHAEAGYVEAGHAGAAHPEAGYAEAGLPPAAVPPPDPDGSAAFAAIAELDTEAPGPGDPDDPGGAGQADSDPGAPGSGERRPRSFGPPHVEQIRTEPSGPVGFEPRAADPGVAAALAELDADEHTEMGEIPVDGGGFEPPSDDDAAGAGTLDPEDRARGAVAAPAEPGGDSEDDEFDGFEILAEADADDEDLLASDGEHDASRRRELRERSSTGGGRPSEPDFAAQLDLGDESDLYIAMQADEFSAHHVIDALNDELTGEHGAGRAGAAGDPGLADPHLAPHLASSAGAALAMFDTGDEALDATLDPPGRPDARRIVQPIFEPEPSSSFTLAAIPSDSLDLEGFPALPPEPRARAARPPVAEPRPAPAILRRPAPSLHGGPVEDHELEHALEALDVDLDDLSGSQATSQLPRDRSRPTAAPRATAARTSGPQPRVPAATPARAVRHPGYATPASGRVITPRTPSEGIEIDFDDDD